MDLRDTEYAREIAAVEHGEARIERLYVKNEDQEEIRFSWWKDGKLMMRPLDLPENDLLVLLEKALDKDIFSSEFKYRLIKMLMK